MHSAITISKTTISREQNKIDELYSLTLKEQTTRQQSITLKMTAEREALQKAEEEFARHALELKARRDREEARLQEEQAKHRAALDLILKEEEEEARRRSLAEALEYTRRVEAQRLKNQEESRKAAEDLRQKLLQVIKDAFDLKWEKSVDDDLFIHVCINLSIYNRPRRKLSTRCKPHKLSCVISKRLNQSWRQKLRLEAEL